MTILSSLRNRIFLTSAWLAVLSIGAAIYLVSVRVTSELEQQLQREVAATGSVVEQLRTTRGQTFTMMARLIADAPKLKAAVDTDDPPTVQATLNSYQGELNANLLLVTNKAGRVLATVGASPRVAALVEGQSSIREAIAGRESFTLLPEPGGLLQLVTVPVAVGISQPDLLGTLSVGFLFDNALAAQLKSVTGSEIAFSMDGQVLATTLPPEDGPALAALLNRADRSGAVTLTGGEYVALPLPLSGEGDARGSGGGPVALVLRSRTEQVRFLRAIHTELEVTAVVAVLLATLLSFAVARTITKPLAAITSVMRDVAATGDLTRKIALSGSRRWDDEDARLLATTFNTLTDSIARFQREIAQKERLSSLGRLSTVIAHEVRNPLMIIKASLHTLKRADLSRDALHEAVIDIDGEIARLNRVVNEVLDFARPIQFEFAHADVNAVCAESAAAAAVGPGAAVHVTCDPSLPPMVIDAERLRIALVNLIVNARQAVEADGASQATSSGRAAAAAGAGYAQPVAAGPADPGGAPPGEAAVRVSTSQSRDGVVISILDAGSGIGATDLAHVFDPFFTTKRGGTGLGLPIAKNIIDGLGGTLTVTTAPGQGTEMRIDLPFGTVHARAS